MVKPSNGLNYETFIFSQYFNDIVDGKPALIKATLDVIAMIDALPKNITLSVEAQVVAAREAYDRLPSLEQQSLVTNFETLKKAESLIEYLKLRDAGTDDGATDDGATEGGFPVWAIVLISVVGAGAIGVGVFFLVRFLLKKKAVVKANAVEDEKSEDNAEATEENAGDAEKTEEDNE